MLPSLADVAAPADRYTAYLDAVAQAGFRGEISPDYASRTVLATDNSIYQRLPQAVVFPRNADDIRILTRLADQTPFTDIVLSPRGGGTGTNGQSLTDGIVVDTSRHMNEILEINPDERWVRVQCGVVKDQLNQALQAHGLFFAPELSTSNRATIGGMINTDASGQGSVLYGKTRDHVLELETVLGDGSLMRTAPLTDEELAERCAREGRVGAIHRTVRAIHDTRQDEIRAIFPPLNRCLTGYDLAHIRDHEGRFNLNNILCGSEGTLGFVTEARLNVLPIPRTSALVNVFYDSFETSLRDAQALMAQGPTSIETVDDIVLELAQGDFVWSSVADYFPAGARKIRGVNLVEYTADSADELEAKLAVIEQHLQQVQGRPSQCTGYTIARGTGEVNKIWAMRKRSVGLLGNVQGEARPIPFVEDTAVPPEHLADFIMGFREILDRRNLRYGMFGHVDCGVLHVRPALDMKDPAQARQVREITEEVVALIKQYGGLLWGEHGKGVRSEFAPAFFGDLFPALQQIKAAFDPRNQLNPGKIATPDDSSALLKIDAVTTRGELDRTIPVQMWDQYADGMYCNGNGACHNWNPNDYMCPSWKATRDRRQTPKGRASLVREWLRQLGARGLDSTELTEKARQQNFLLSLPGRAWRTLTRNEQDFNQAIHDSMMGCLACKSCTGQCPVKVDVPTFRAQFLEVYYSRHLRPLKDYLIGGLEYVVPWLAKVRPLYNIPMRSRPVRWLLQHGAGMVDSPLLSRTSLKRALRQRGIPLATVQTLSQLSDEERARALILVQDAFTSFFDTDTVIDVLDSFRALGFTPLVMPFLPNGKPLHVHGFHNAFEKAAKQQALWLRGLSAHDVPLVGIDPSMVLAFRSEYRKLLGDAAVPDVLLPQEYLAQQQALFATQAASTETFYLLGHCTESTNAAPSIRQWQQVFAAAGLKLETLSVGCCGMAGTFGHETRNRQTSETIYDLSWRTLVENPAYAGRLVASGYSCRTQSQRLSGATLPHPLSALKQQLSAPAHTQ
ncbi:FAD-binding oxidoreductase [Natronospirillum operosum]|uniref:D-2-hydroxyglutarate dehydrogenase n=1 Tax=Natronospirillum operosum TaxID=2759953 RepID=A0A4Z0WBI6_9GAMM|nr:FAD-binding and (Fe-S)-binding domain-containing protein [Natronospirillum operosum]TGG95502.1 FAD-binding oxidoreductase [Natronospirillum operosum]